MRTSIASRLAPALGALALFAAPVYALQSRLVTPPAVVTVASLPATSWSGVYRVQLAGKNAAPAAIIVERTFDGFSAMMLIDEHGTPLTKLRVDGDSLTGRVQTQSGDGVLKLRIDGETITGTLTVGREKWDVTGQRTA